MSGPVEPCELAKLAGDLEDALALWSTRDDSGPQPEVRRAATAAVTAIDAMLRQLGQLRARLVSEIRRSDDASAARVEALLAETVRLLSR